MSECGGDLAGRGDGSWAASGPRPVGDLGLGPRSDREGVRLALRRPLPGPGARSAEPGELAGHTAAAGRVPRARSRGNLWRLPVGGSRSPGRCVSDGTRPHGTGGGGGLCSWRKPWWFSHACKKVPPGNPTQGSFRLALSTCSLGGALGRASSRAGGASRSLPAGSVEAWPPRTGGVGSVNSLQEGSATWSLA